MKGQISLQAVLGYIVLLAIYLLAIAPLMWDIVTTALPDLDPITAGIVVFLPAIAFIAIIVSLFKTAFGRENRPLY